MKKLLFLLTALCVFTSSFATFHVEIKDHLSLDASKIFLPIGKSGQKISLLELSKISRTDLETLTGRKMNFFERITFKKTQKRLSKGINQYGIITDKKINNFLSNNASGNTTGFNGIGFILGFLLSLLGVLIAYIMNDDEDKKNRVKWAWIGFGVGALLYILLVVLIFASGGII